MAGVAGDATYAVDLRSGARPSHDDDVLTVVGQLLCDGRADGSGSHDQMRAHRLSPGDGLSDAVELTVFTSRT